MPIFPARAETAVPHVSGSHRDIQKNMLGIPDRRRQKDEDQHRGLGEAGEKQVLAFEKVLAPRLILLPMERTAGLSAGCFNPSIQPKRRQHTQKPHNERGNLAEC